MMELPERRSPSALFVFRHGENDQDALRPKGTRRNTVLGIRAANQLLDGPGVETAMRRRGVLVLGLHSPAVRAEKADVAFVNGLSAALEREGIKAQTHLAPYAPIGPLALTRAAKGKSGQELETALMALHRNGSHPYFQKTKDGLEKGAAAVVALDRAMQDGNLGALAKHFPGREAAIQDALLENPVVILAMASHSGVNRTGGQVEQIARAFGMPMEKKGGVAAPGEGFSRLHGILGEGDDAQYAFTHHRTMRQNPEDERQTPIIEGKFRMRGAADLKSVLGQNAAFLRHSLYDNVPILLLVQSQRTLDAVKKTLKKMGRRGRIEAGRERFFLSGKSVQIVHNIPFRQYYPHLVAALPAHDGPWLFWGGGNGTPQLAGAKRNRKELAELSKRLADAGVGHVILSDNLPTATLWRVPGRKRGRLAD